MRTLKNVTRCMRGARFVIALFGGLLVALVADAQQAPEYGCTMSPNCRPAGFSMLNRERGIGGLYGPGFGIKWDPGFELTIPGTKNYPGQPEPTKPPAPSEGQVFHLGTGHRLAPPLTLTPVPAPPAIPPKD